MKPAIIGPAPFAARRRALVLRAVVAGALIGLTLLAPSLRAAGAQSTARGGAWTMPDPTDLVARAIRRIVTQDKPGGLPVADFAHRTFGREETAAAVRAFLGRGTVLATEAFSPVQGWPSARATDTLPCARPAAESPAASATLPEDPCRDRNALWLAITKIERGPLPHELHLWYATHFRADAQGSVHESTYSFCERWLRVGGTWKYDGFVRVSRGVVSP